MKPDVLEFGHAECVSEVVLLCSSERLINFSFFFNFKINYNIAIWLEIVNSIFYFVFHNFTLSRQYVYRFVVSK